MAARQQAQQPQRERHQVRSDERQHPTQARQPRPPMRGPPIIPRSHPPRFRGQGQRPGDGGEHQSGLEAVHQLVGDLPVGQADEDEQEGLHRRGVVDAGEAHEAQGVGQRRQPQGRPQRDQRRQGEHQQHDEGEVDGAGGPGEGGCAGVVGVVAPVEHLGVVEGDVGVVHGEDGRAEAGAVKQSGQQNQEGDGGVEGAVCPALSRMSWRSLFGRCGVWLRECGWHVGVVPSGSRG